MITRITMVLLAVLAISLQGLEAQNKSMEGVWDVTGTNPEGVAYEGKLKIKAINKPLYQMAWDVKYENAEKNQTFPGTALVDQKTDIMYAAYGINTLRYGLISYPLEEDGSLQGSATWTSHKGVGAELLGNKRGDDKIVGTYEVVGRRAPEDANLGAANTYDGTLIISKKGDRYELAWYLGDGKPYKGFAYKTENALIGVWGIGGSYGMEIYTLSENRKKAEATWTTPSYEMGAGKEVIIKQ